MADIIELCREAWIGSKGESQPAYDDLIQSYRDMLTERAERILAGEYVSDGPFQAFEILIRDSTRRAAENADAEKAKPLTTAVKEELVEEVEHKTPKGSLPDDFPAHAKLHEAGINTYGQLAKVDDLTTINGVGPVLAKEITKCLKADEKELNK